MPDANPKPTIEHMYVDTPNGQIHARYLSARVAETQPPLVCLHPAPFSGLYFTNLMPLMNSDRAVLAPDYPGYGGSPAHDDWPDIVAYASAMLDLTECLELPHIDILGFHTGGLIATEMALIAAERIRHLFLVDIPFLDATARKLKYDSDAKPREFSTELDSLADEWAFNIKKRLGAMSFDRAFELFVESLRSGKRANWALGAAYSYPSEVRLPALTADTTIIATRSALLEPTRAAAAAVPGARLIERLDITPPVFEKHAVDIAGEIDAVLHEPEPAK
jgi:pimeloyl-ACP methyl ester carboxylesterase